MLIVKITALCIVLSIIISIIIGIIVSSSTETKVLIAENKGPKWYDICCIIVAILVCLSILGSIYSVIYLLFIH